MKYDFSQEDANEMLEKADANNDALTHKNVTLKARLEQLEAIAEEMAESLRNGLESEGTLEAEGSIHDKAILSKYEAYKSQVSS